MAKENAKKRNVRRNFFVLGRFIVTLLTIFACRCYDRDIEQKRWKNRQLISKGKKRERTWFLMKKLLALLLVAVMAMGLCSVASAEGYDQALIDAAKAEGELTVYGQLRGSLPQRRLRQVPGALRHHRQPSAPVHRRGCRQDRGGKRQSQRRRVVRRHHRSV